MRFLSFSQPWLHVVLLPEELGGKRIENRSWAPPTSQIGQRIALHAAKSWDASAVGFISRLGISIPMRFDLYAKSAILGVATIDKVLTGWDEESIREHAEAISFSDGRLLGHEQIRWFFGPVGWLLADVRPLATPIPMRGAQGLRTLPPEVEAEINAQMGGTR